MKPALTTVSLIISGLSCGVQAKAQDSKTGPAPNITENVVSLAMVYAPAWSGLTRSGVSHFRYPRCLCIGQPTWQSFILRNRS